jgi:hypothetical protein
MNRGVCTVPGRYKITLCGLLFIVAASAAFSFGAEMRCTSTIPIDSPASSSLGDLQVVYCSVSADALQMLSGSEFPEGSSALSSFGNPLPAFSAGHQIMIGGIPIPSGNYSLDLRRSSGEWYVVIARLFSEKNDDSKQEEGIGRIPLALDPSLTPNASPHLMITFRPRPGAICSLSHNPPKSACHPRDEFGELHFSWGNTDLFTVITGVALPSSSSQCEVGGTFRDGHFQGRHFQGRTEFPLMQVRPRQSIRRLDAWLGRP